MIVDKLTENLLNKTCTTAGAQHAIVNQLCVKACNQIVSTKYIIFYGAKDCLLPSLLIRIFL